MYICIKERQYKFRNGYFLKVSPTEVKNISIAEYYDPAGNLLISTQTKKITERLGIVNHIESICKQNLTVFAESITYSLYDVIIDEECMNLDAVVIPHLQRSHAAIDIKLFRYSPQTNYDNCLYAYTSKTSFMAYSGIEEAIRTTIDEYNNEINNDKYIELSHNKVELTQRILYFNNEMFRVEVRSLNHTHGDMNVIGYNLVDNNKMIFALRDESINIYERREVIKKVASICSSYGINIQKMDREESEYFNGMYGSFMVVPLNNNSIKIYTPGVFDMQRKVDLKYDDYERIMYCVREMVNKIRKNPLKYKRKDINEKKRRWHI